MAQQRPLSAPSSGPGLRISRIVIFAPTLLAQGRRIRRLSMGNLQMPLRGLYPPSPWGAWENPMKSLKPRFFWRLMIPVLSRVSSCSLMAAEGKSNRETLHRRPLPCRFQAGCFRRPATVFRISCESASSDTARANDIAPTRALKVRIALDLAARLFLPGSKPAIKSRSALT